MVGLRVYLIVEETHSGYLRVLNRDAVASRLSEMLCEAGLLLGLAIAVYLLAPAAQTPEDPPPATTPSA